MNKPLAAILLSTAVILTSCNKNHSGPAITSGKIEYKITYLNKDLDKKTRNILPTKMKLIFNQKEAANQIDGFMGMYKLNAFTDFHTRKCSTILKVFDKHYLFKGGREEQMCCFNTMEDMVIHETDETKIIAGFNCKKAIITFPSSEDTIHIYYTDEIKLKHPNVTNPYKKVKGVLMEFELTLLYLKMRFEAEKYDTIEEELLQPKVHQNSKLVSRDQMTQILNRLMD
jgi:GLPGLI family protein